MKRMALLLPLLLALAACSREPDRTGPEAPAAAAATASTVPDLPEGPAPAANPDGTPDPAMVERFVAAGVEPDEARFLALSTYQITQPAPDVVHLVMTYPWGDVYRAGVRARPVDASEVKPFEVLASSIEPGRISGTYRFYVNLAELPPEAFAALTGPAQGMRLPSLGDFLVASAHAQQPLQIQPYSGPNADLANRGSGWLEATYAWAISQLQDETRDAVVNKAFGSGAGGKITKVLDAVKHAKDASDLSGVTQKLLDELDKLRKCVQNPTEPKTKERYEQNPAEQQRLLDAIDAARAEIIISAAAVASGTTGEVVSGTGGAVGKVLGVALGPLIEKTKAEIEQQMQNSVQRIRNMVVPCTGWRLTVDGGGCGTVSFVTCDITKPFTETLSCPGAGTYTVTHTPYSRGPAGGTVRTVVTQPNLRATADGTYTLSIQTGDRKEIEATYSVSNVCTTVAGKTHCYPSASGGTGTWRQTNEPCTQ